MVVLNSSLLYLCGLLLSPHFEDSKSISQNRGQSLMCMYMEE